MLKGFKDFLFRGNIIDLAVAVVIGTAFTALISTFTSAMIQPLIGVFLGGGATGGTLTLRGQVFDFGAVINAVITFLITAAVVYFLIVTPMKRLMERRAGGEEQVADTPAPSDETVLLGEIRDLLRASSGTTGGSPTV